MSTWQGSNVSDFISWATGHTCNSLGGGGIEVSGWPGRCIGELFHVPQLPASFWMVCTTYNRANSPDCWPFSSSFSILVTSCSSTNQKPTKVKEMWHVESLLTPTTTHHITLHLEQHYPPPTKKQDWHLCVDQIPFGWPEGPVSESSCRP